MKHLNVHLKKSNVTLNKSHVMNKSFAKKWYFNDERAFKVPSIDMDKYMTLSEKPNVDILNHLVENKSRYKFTERERRDVSKYEPWQKAKEYRDLHDGDEVKILYRQNYGEGRFQALNGLGLQLITREIRHSIAKDRYRDIDIVNAHPIFFEFLCSKLGIQTPCLSHYIEHRDEVLSGVENGKRLFLSMMNGGTSCSRITSPRGIRGNLSKTLKRKWSFCTAISV